jgi:hypothetical protein
VPRPRVPRRSVTGCPERHSPGRRGPVPGTLVPGPRMPGLRVPGLPIARVPVPRLLRIPPVLVPRLPVSVVPIARLQVTGVVKPGSRAPGSASAGFGGIILDATGTAVPRLVTGARTVARAGVPGVRPPALLVRRPCAAHWDGSLSWVAWCRRASGSLHHAATQQRPATWSGALIPVARPGRGSSPGATTTVAGHHVGRRCPAGAISARA